MLVERDPEPRDRPGEALHPGIEPLLETLGASDALRASTLTRYRGHWLGEGNSRRRFLSFGGDDQGPWLGFQAERRRLDAALREAAERSGAVVRTGIAVADILRDSTGRVTGVLTSTGEALRARIVIDAAGGRHWIARKLGVGVRRLSPRYVATFGYVRLRPGQTEPGLVEDPDFSQDGGGWTWIAPLGNGRWHWTRMSFDGSRMPAGWVPPPLARLIPCGPSRGADVTWRLVRSAAGPGWMAVGDAAGVLDPAASHGVLRALYSGAMAGKAAAEASARLVGEGEPLQAYDDWFRAGLIRDAGQLRTAYEALETTSEAAFIRLPVR